MTPAQVRHLIERARQAGAQVFADGRHNVSISAPPPLNVDPSIVQALSMNGALAAQALRAEQRAATPEPAAPAAARAPAPKRRRYFA